MIVEVNFISSLLPKHYKCTARENGVHCKSDIGICDIIDGAYFRLFIKAIEAEYKYRLLEIYHQVCTDHKEFTVFLRPRNYTPEFGYELLVLVQKIFPLAEELGDNSLYNEMQRSYWQETMTGLFNIVDRHFYKKEFFQDLKKRRSSILKNRDINLDELEHMYNQWLGEDNHETMEA